MNHNNKIGGDMKYWGTFTAFVIWVSGNVSAQECSHLWGFNLSTDALTAKGNAGDTTAGYAWFPFRGDSRLRLVFKGAFPNARFVSAETYEGRLNSHYEALLDFMIKPDLGSLNPFQEGVDMAVAQRDFTIDVVPAGSQVNTGNVLRFPLACKPVAFYYRILNPNKSGVLTSEILPKVFAYDIKTGEARSCPPTWYMPEYVNIPQFVPDIFANKKDEIKFKTFEGFDVGANTAIPGYLYAINDVDE